MAQVKLAKKRIHFFIPLITSNYKIDDIKKTVSAQIHFNYKCYRRGFSYF